MILFYAPIVITMNSRLDVLKPGYIGVEEGLIRYIGRSKPKEYDEIIEFPNSIITPGFINAHTHVAMTLLRGLKDDADLIDWLYKYILPAESLLKPNYVYYGALYGIAEMLSSGITTFADMYYFEIEIAKATLKAGVRALLGYSLSDLWFNRSSEDEVKIAEEFYQQLEQLRKNENAADQLFFAYAPHSAYGCSKECLLLVREKANEKKVRIHTHLSESLNEIKIVKEQKGDTPIKFMEKIGFLSDDVMAAHVVWVTDTEEFNILKKRYVNVLHNPTSNLKLASGIAPIPQMLEKGINVALATDGPASNNRLDIIKEMHIAALIHKGYTRDPTVVSAREVLKMASINGAKALGLSDKIGSLEVGKFADFVVFNLKKGLQSSPFHDVYSMIVYALDSSFVERVYVSGKEVYNNGNFNFDIEKIREKVQDIRNKLEEEIKH